MYLSSEGVEREIPLVCFDSVALVQGLLRELYKAQGHSTTGSIDWDWNKFDSSPGSSRSESSSGGGMATTPAAGYNEAAKATAGTVLGLAAFTAAEGITSRTQVFMSEKRGQCKVGKLELTALDFCPCTSMKMVGREFKLELKCQQFVPHDVQQMLFGVTSSHLSLSLIVGQRRVREKPCSSPLNCW